jgi:hypothetical protein
LTILSRKGERREGDDEFSFRASRLGGMKEREMNEKGEVTRRDKGEERRQWRRRDDIEDRSLEA